MTNASDQAHDSSAEVDHGLEAYGLTNSGYFGGVHGLMHVFEVGRAISRAVMGTGITFGVVGAGVAVNHAYDKSGSVGAAKEAVAQAGGLAGAEYGASFGVTLGARIGLPGAIFGGIIGGVLGHYYGVKALKSILENEPAEKAGIVNSPELNSADIAEFDKDGLSLFEAKQALEQDKNRAREIAQERDYGRTNRGGLSPDERQERNDADRAAAPDSPGHVGPNATPGSPYAPGSSGGGNFGSIGGSSGGSAGGRTSNDPYGDNDSRHFGGGAASPSIGSGSDRSSGSGSGGYNSSGPGSAPGNLGGVGGNMGSHPSSPGSSGSDPSSSRGNSGGSGGGRRSGDTYGDNDGRHFGGGNYDSGFGQGRPSQKGENGRLTGRVPVILDLDGNGIGVTEFSQSGKFMDSIDDGLLHRTAWAAKGDGVLFVDPDNLGYIRDTKQYVFTEWDPTASGDLEAIRSVFDTSGDGVLNNNDAAFSQFKIEVTNADGSTSVMTLAEAGIASINLTADTTSIELPDGSRITGQTLFTKVGGGTGTVANVALMSDVQGYAVTPTTATDGAGVRTVTSTALNADGSMAFILKSVTSATGGTVTNSWDFNGDGVWDRVRPSPPRPAQAPRGTRRSRTP